MPTIRYNLNKLFYIFILKHWAAIKIDMNFFLYTMFIKMNDVHDIL